MKFLIAAENVVIINSKDQGELEVELLTWPSGCDSDPPAPL